MCIAALMRFTARRDKLSTMLSENDSNNVGAARVKKEYIDKWNTSEVESKFAWKQINWKFNPPGAPYFGGVWERLNRHCKKKTIVFVLEGRSRYIELLQTTKCIVEQMLNSRLISTASSDPQDLEAQTPIHFLLGRPSNSSPHIRDAEKFIDSRKTFKKARAYRDCTWRRRYTEYIPQLNIRSKWAKSENQNLKKIVLVWIMDDQEKRCDCKMGLVLETYLGSDGIVRSALIKSRYGSVLKRPCVNSWSFQ